MTSLPTARVPLAATRLAPLAPAPVTRLAFNRFAFLFSFAILLNGYASGVPGLSLGSVVYVVLILAAFFATLASHGSVPWIVVLVPFAALFLTMLSGVVVANPWFSWSATVFALAKLFTLVGVAALVGARWFDLATVNHWLWRFAALMTGYLYLQTLLFAFGFVLPNLITLGPLHPYASGYAEVPIYLGGMLRPAGMLSEPAFYASFLSLAITTYFERWFNDFSLRRLLVLAFFSVGVILSTSTSGILALPIIWLVYLARMRLRGFAVAAGLLAFALAFLRFGAVSLGTVLSSNLWQVTIFKLTNLDTSARVGISYQALGWLTPRERLVGVGWGNAPQLVLARSTDPNPSTYVNSAVSLIVETGYIGLGVFVALMALLLIRCIQAGSMLAVLLLAQYLAGGTGSGMYFSTFGVLYMTYIFYLSRRPQDSQHEGDTYDTPPPEHHHSD